MDEAEVCDSGGENENGCCGSDGGGCADAAVPSAVPRIGDGPLSTPQYPTPPPPRLVLFYVAVPKNPGEVFHPKAPLTDQQLRNIKCAGNVLRRDICTRAERLRPNWGASATGGGGGGGGDGNISSTFLPPSLLAPHVKVDVWHSPYQNCVMAAEEIRQAFQEAPAAHVKVSLVEDMFLSDRFEGSSTKTPAKEQPLQPESSDAAASSTTSDALAATAGSGTHGGGSKCGSPITLGDVCRLHEANALKRSEAFQKRYGAFYSRVQGADSQFDLCCRLVGVVNAIKQRMTMRASSAAAKSSASGSNDEGQGGGEAQKESGVASPASTGIDDSTPTFIVLVTHPEIIKCMQLLWHRYSPEWFNAEPVPLAASIQLSEESKDCGYLFGGFGQADQNGDGVQLTPVPGVRVREPDVVRRGDARASAWAAHFPHHLCAAAVAAAYAAAQPQPPAQQQHRNAEVSNGCTPSASCGAHPHQEPGHMTSSGGGGAAAKSALQASTAAAAAAVDITAAAAAAGNVGSSGTFLPSKKKAVELPKIEIILVRCGKPLHNSDLPDCEIPLSRESLLQMDVVARELKAHLEEREKHNELQGHVRMWVSPYQRARDTAGKLLEHLNPTCGRQYVGSVKENIFLSERCLGFLHPKLTSSLLPNELDRVRRYNVAGAPFWFRPPFGESYFDVSNRLTGIISDIHAGAYLPPAGALPISTVILVTHADVIKSFVSSWMRYSTDWFVREPVPPVGSIQVIRHSFLDEGYHPSTGINGCGLVQYLSVGTRLRIPRSLWDRAAPDECFLVAHGDETIASIVESRVAAVVPSKTPLQLEHDIRCANPHLAMQPYRFHPKTHVCRRGDPSQALWSKFLHIEALHRPTAVDATGVSETSPQPQQQPPIRRAYDHSHAQWDTRARSGSGNDHLAVPSSAPAAADRAPASTNSRHNDSYGGGGGMAAGGLSLSDSSSGFANYRQQSSAYPLSYYSIHNPSFEDTAAAAVASGRAPLRIILVRHGQSEANINPHAYASQVDCLVPLTSLGMEQAEIAGEELRTFLEKNARTEPTSQEEHIRMWVSPFLRTRQTAEKLLTKLNPSIGHRWVHSVRESSSLGERDWGYHEGLNGKLPPGTRVTIRGQAQPFVVSEPLDLQHISSDHNNMSIADLLDDNPDLYPSWRDRHMGRYFEEQHVKSLYRDPNGESLLDTATRIARMCEEIQMDYQLREEPNRVTTCILVTHGAAIRAFLAAWFRLPLVVLDQFLAPENLATYCIESNVHRCYPIFNGFLRQNQLQRAPSALELYQDDHKEWKVRKSTSNKSVSKGGGREE